MTNYGKIVSSVRLSALTAFMQSIHSPPMNLKDAITSRLKIMAKLVTVKAICRKRAHHAEDDIVGTQKRSISVSHLAQHSGREESCSGCSTKKHLRARHTKRGFEPESLVQI